MQYTIGVCYSQQASCNGLTATLTRCSFAAQVPVELYQLQSADAVIQLHFWNAECLCLPRLNPTAQHTNSE